MTIELRNDFEYDWCVSALNGVKRELTGLKGTGWLFCAQKTDELLEACIRFLKYADQRLDLGLRMDVLVGAEDYDAAVETFPFATVRNIDKQESSLQADYCVYWGYSQMMESCRTVEELEHAARRMGKFWAQIALPRHRAMCVSTAGVYNPYKYPVMAAEEEFQKHSDDPERIFARRAEQLTACCGCSHVILRPGIVLAAGLRMDSPVADLLDKLVRKEQIDAVSARTKYSLVYITDFLTAWIRTAVSPRANGAYNVSDSDESVSLLRICELYMEASAENRQFDLKLETAANTFNYALDGSKLKTLGWQRTVDLKTMIAMEIGSRSGKGNRMRFPDNYRGKQAAMQNCLFGILCQIDRICSKYDIQYFLAGGTLLGAARHQGFIPWDDDLDVMMLRKDYERFLAVVRDELPEQMFLQTPATDPGNHYLISKIRLNDTVFSSEYLLRFPQLHNGIFVDVIAQDYTANSRLGQKLHLKLSLLARGLVFKKWSGGSAAAVGRKYAIFDLVKKLASFKTLEWFQNKVLTMFNGMPGRKYLYDSMGINLAKGAYPAQWLSGQTKIRFNGGEFPAPVEYDQYLKYLYGEYMQPAPVTQRTSSHTVPWVDLGPYAEDPDGVQAALSGEGTDCTHA